MKQAIKIGSHVMLSTTLSDLPLQYGAEGVVKDQNIEQDPSEMLVEFSDGTYWVPVYDLRVTKPRAKMNDRELIQYEYREWVDRVSDDIDWKTNFTIDEIQDKYSEIALKYALGIIEKHLEMNHIDSHKMLAVKRSQIKEMLK